MCAFLEKGLSASLSLRAAHATKLLQRSTGDCLSGSKQGSRRATTRLNTYIPKGTAMSDVAAVLQGVRFKECRRR